MNVRTPPFAQLGAATESTFGAPKDVHDVGVHDARTLQAFGAEELRLCQIVDAKGAAAFRRRDAF